MQCYEKQSFDSLLVALATTDNLDIPLLRAAHIARQTQAQITVVLVAYDRTIELISSLSHQHGDRLKESFLSDKQVWLNQQFDRPELNNLKIKAKVCWHKHPHQAIADQITQFHYDLVIKGSALHSEFESLFITPTDWHLLRECHGPILLVKSSQQSADKPRILLAIDMDNHNADHHYFNSKMLQQANHLSGKLHSEVHLVNCYLEDDMSMAISPPADGKEAVRNGEKIRQQHLSELHQLAQQYHIDSENVHLVQGLADHVIPRVARDINAGLVILGSCGRTGLSESMFGHTAEHIFDQISCDMLALKPDESRLSLNHTIPL